MFIIIKCLLYSHVLRPATSGPPSPLYDKEDLPIG